MRTKETTVYQYNELSDKAKERARDWYREGNLDYDWFESDYEALETIGKIFGMEVDLKRTYFSGFYSQSSGSSFEASIDIVKMFECIRLESWKTEFPKVEFRFPPQTKNMLRVIRIAKYLDVNASVSNTNRETGVRVSLDWDSNQPSGLQSYDNIDEVMREIEEYTQDVAEEINNWFYRWLESDYEYLTSDECIAEGIIANEYEFDEDGRRA